MESTPPSLPGKARSFDARKFMLAFLVLLISLGALGWQLLDYRRNQVLVDGNNPNLPPAQWRKATTAEAKAVTASITSQLEAFKRDDYQAATKYQSAGLRRKFASVSAFRTMIQSSYPQFAHYKTARFGPVQADKSGKLAMVPVDLVGSDGKPEKAEYQMILEEGLWRVAGVVGGLAAPRPAPRAKGETTA